MTQFPTQPPPAPFGMPAGMRPHRGVLILVFGILSWVICVVFGVVAWVMGNTDLRAMEEGTMDASGQGLTQAGKIVGMIHVILSVIAIPIVIFIVIAAALAGGAASRSGP